MKRFLAGTAQPLSDDEVAIVAITPGVKRDGDAWEPAGVDLTEFQRNPIVLASHDVTRPIGVAAVELVGNQISGRIRFAPSGASRHADEWRALAKAGVVTGVSASMIPLVVEPLDPRYFAGGERIVRCELVEISLVAVPADPEARIVARSFGGASRATLLRTLPPISAHAREQLRRVLKRSPEEQRLVAAAAEVGETLTPMRVAEIVAEASRLGQSAEFRYRWLRMAYGQADSGQRDFQRRQAALRELAP